MQKPAEEKPIETVYMEAHDLLKSTGDKLQLNEVTLELKPRTEDVFIAVPFYYNTENHTKELVRKPSFTPEGCTNKYVSLPDTDLDSIPGANPSNMPVLGWSRGNNAGEPQAEMAYDIEESNSRQNTDHTFTIIFKVAPSCTKIKFTFEAFFK